jgi:hypothetical protein
MALEIREVVSKRDRRLFLELPYRLHRNHELWVPPLRLFEKQYLNPRRNLHLPYSEVACLLALRHEEPLGRVMGIVNRRLNEYWNMEEARFCSFESVDDPEVARSLLGNLEEWARERGADRVTGPLGFSNQDPQGFLIEGFQERPSIGTIYNHPYVPGLIEDAGYSKEVDYVTYKIVIPREAPETLRKIVERVQKRMAVELIEFDRKAEARRMLPEVFRFMNETYTEIDGFLPLSEEIIERTVHRYSHILDPQFLKVLQNDRGDMVAFIFGIKDVTEGFRRARGRLLPLGYFKLLIHQRRSKRLDLLLGAIREDYRGRGLDMLLAISMMHSAHTLGLEIVDTHHELESNRLIRAEMEKVGGILYKRHRVYRKDL